MKSFASFVSVLVLMAVPAFGAANKPQNVVIPQNVQVGTTQIAAGTYKLAYTGTGANVQVTLTQEGKTVATFAAKAVDQKNPGGGIGIRNNGGVATLESIMLDKVSLQLVGTAQAGQ